MEKLNQLNSSDLKSYDISSLRVRIINSLEKQGFNISNGIIIAPENKDKDLLRKLHNSAVLRNVEKARPGLKRYESELIKSIANGSDIDPYNIKPRLVKIERNTKDELLFRYARLHWAVPISAGYGRRIRFLVIDESNNKLIGVIGLCDPIYNLRPRDEWIGWKNKLKKSRMRSIMDAFVLGAVPPYSDLLFGKLVALLAASNEVKDAVREKYDGKTTIISKESHDGKLALLTTISALGRSSIYNRLRYNEKKIYESVGYTSGSGEFHFSNGIYNELRSFALDHCDATAKNSLWGNGFRSRREIVLKSLPILGLSPDLIYHGIRREIFVIPIAENSREYLCGATEDLNYDEITVDNFYEWFKSRWLESRIKTNNKYKEFNKETYRIWR